MANMRRIQLFQQGTTITGGVMATQSIEWNANDRVERRDREAVLAVISASPSVTIEELLQHLPGMRWGYLFSILGECLQEGLVTLRQKEFQFEVIHSLQRRSGEDVVAKPVASSAGDRRMTN
jgi:hypothetical protein